MNFSPSIYRKDALGRIRFWRYEVEGNKWRTAAGLLDGSPVISEWTYCKAASQPTDEAQAIFEAQAEMRKKLERQYHERIEDCDKPNFFEPMLAKKYDPVKAQGRILYSQPKLDGVRCIARIEGLFTRQGKPITSCPHIYEALRPRFEQNPDLIFDGELYNHEYKSDFERLVSAIRKKDPTLEAEKIVQYHVYDLPSQEGNFSIRFYHLLQMALNPVIREVSTHIVVNQEHLDGLYSKYLELGYEGQMVRLDMPYEQKRSAHLLKRKEFLDDEFEIVEIIEGNGNWGGYAKRVTVRMRDGREFGAGISGDQAFCKSLLENKQEWIGKKVTVKYFTPTADGIPRFPVATRFYSSEKI
jgi:DNA ligase 1